MSLLFLALAWLVSYSAFATETKPDLIIKPITAEVYLYQSSQQLDGWGLVTANGLIVVNGQQAVMIDTPWSEQATAQLVAWLAEKNFI